MPGKSYCEAFEVLEQRKEVNTENLSVWSTDPSLSSRIAGSERETLRDSGGREVRVGEMWIWGPLAFTNIIGASHFLSKFSLAERTKPVPENGRS